MPRRPGSGCASSADRSGSTSTRTRRPDSSALGQQQQLEIIKALWRGSKVLILDEPTSMLTPQGVTELEQIARTPEGAGAGRDLHHPQASRGGLDGRSRLRAQSGAARRRDRAWTSCARRRHEELQERIIALMFGEPGGHAADVAELTDEVEWHAPRTPQATEPALELDGVTVEPGPGEIGAYDVVASGAEERDHGHRRRGRQRPARARRGDRRAASAATRRHSPVRPLARRSSRSRSARSSGSATSPTIACTRAPSGRMTVAMNIVLKQIGKRPTGSEAGSDTAPSSPRRGS